MDRSELATAWAKIEFQTLSPLHIEFKGKYASLEFFSLTDFLAKVTKRLDVFAVFTVFTHFVIFAVKKNLNLDF